MTITLDDLKKLNIPSDIAGLLEVYDSKVQVKRTKTGITNILQSVTVTPTAPATFNDSDEAVDWDQTTSGTLAVPADTDPQEAVLTLAEAKVLRKLMLRFFLQPDDALGNVKIELSQDGTTFPYVIHNEAPDGNQITWLADNSVGYLTKAIRITTSGSTAVPLQTTIFEIEGYEATYWPFHIYSDDGESFLYFDLKTPFRLTDEMATFVTSTNVPMNTHIRFQIGIDNEWYYLDSGTWTKVSNEKSSWLVESNTEAEINTDIDQIAINGTENVYIRVLVQTTTDATPSITDISAT